MNPTADARYLAAVLTDSTDDAVSHLQRALVYDPRHSPSLKRLRQLNGVASVGLFSLLVNEYKAFCIRQCQYSRWLNQLSRSMPIGVVSIVPLLFLTVLVVSLISGFVSRPGPVFADQPPMVTTLRYLTADDVVARFATSDIRIARIEGVQDAAMPGKQSLRLLLDAPGTPVAEVFLYNSISSLLQDSSFLEQSVSASHVIAAYNAVLVYPRGLASQYATPLASVFASLRET